ncbi:molecular chaperone DnaK [Corallococcus sp. CA053C]|uniref:Hsp70 family protein n=1 Tax=Corallococcus sp. CA053C TaxID=2316732 RepID=UPI000EA0D345|nr:Hsp70 family protein [Corallococcus sp. CA053C]RKG98867.1 molecular chaperone DnaK [Corallococcus sp. CA053C]
MSHVVGIDLGTTHSLVAALDGAGRPTLLPNRLGQRLTPSVVGLDSEGRLHVGESARTQLLVHPERTVAEVKRRMGRDLPVTLGDRRYSPTEISALILKALREDAERALGGTVTEAVVTVPAYFSDAQRQATKDAGELAGLKVERLLNEPTAAALAYGVNHLDAEQYVLVYDLGGGTFDVSVLEMFQGVLDVKASAGNNQLGGSDFDQLLAAWFAAQFEREHGVSLVGNLAAQVRLKAAAEAAKIALSSVESTPVIVPFLAPGRGGAPASLEVEVTRARFEGLVTDLVRSTLEPMEGALRDAKLSRKAIAEVVLVGGSSRVPLVRRLVAEYFGREPREGVNPDEAVALGAALQAGLKTGAVSPARGIMLTDVCPFTLGVEVQASAGRERVGGVFSPLIPRNTTVPVSRTETFATTADGQRAVEIRVFQGEARLVRDNILLDEYLVEGVPPAKAGAEKVAVTFTYDINGILNVTTRVASTGKEAVLVVDKRSQRLSPERRNEARERLAREWGEAPVASAPGLASASASASAPGLASASASATRDSDADALLTAATERIATAPAAVRPRLESLCAALREARAKGDRVTAARLDAELTDLLFDLG